jgi:hypothetical protein
MVLPILATIEVFLFFYRRASRWYYWLAMADSAGVMQGSPGKVSRAVIVQSLVVPWESFVISFYIIGIYGYFKKM